MIPLENLQEHLERLKAKDWNKLLELLPEMAETAIFGELKGGDENKDGSINFPFYHSASIVDKTINAIYELKIIPVFDWTSWEEGKSILDHESFNYATLDSISLCKIITILIRADRFNDGLLISYFENGVIPKIIRGLLIQVNFYNYTLEIKAILFGVAVGDALGVPVEFKSRAVIRQNPVTDMIGYGTYHLPAGTWSDDSSLTFCLAEALTKDFNLNTIGQNFVKWGHHNYWTATGDVFDIGITTKQAINRLAKGERPERAGGFDANSNGNGSLMRIAPLLFHLLDKPMEERYELTQQVSSITHGHIRSVIACFYYLEFLRQLLDKKDKFEIYRNLQVAIPRHLRSLSIDSADMECFDRLFNQNIHHLAEEHIYSTGYVLHTLEASIWCLMTTDNYEDAVLKAVNLGDDTDTTGAVTGGLAGLLYGVNQMPKNWMEQLAKYEDIDDLAERMGDKMVAGK